MNSEDDFKENKMTFLQMVQDIINRMASNSSNLKTLYITILSALIVFFIDKDIINIKICFIITGITLVFYGLDSYYLSLERKYVNLYNKIINKDFPNKLLNYSLASISFNPKKDINRNNYKDTRIINTLISPSTILFYIPILVINIAIICLYSI